MRSTVDQRARRIQCDLAARPHRQRELPSAMQRATWGCSAQIARRLNLSQRLVEAWGNQIDPNRSPAEVLCELMEESLAHHEAADALAPLTAMAERFSFDLVQQPVQLATSRDVIATAATALRETTEAIAAAIEAAPGGIYRVELERIKREGHEAIEQFHRLLRVAEAEAASGQRNGPRAG